MSAPKQTANNESSGVVFDTQKKIVLASLPHENKSVIERKIATVKEVVPNKTNHEIGLVLQFYEYNVSETISAFLEDKAAVVLNEWNCTNNKPKKNKRKDNKKDSDVDKGKGRGDGVSLKSQSGGDKGPIGDNAIPSNVGSGLEHKKTSTISSQPSGKLSVDSKNSSSTKQISVSNVGGTNKQQNRKKSLEKPIKELGRHSVSLQRMRHLLSEEMDRSEKRLKQSFRDLHKILEEREAELARELMEVKDEANRLLASRMSRAESLKIGTNRADVMNDGELKELRIDIKHFVSERKFDDDMGRTVRFVRDHDRMVKAIKDYGEVVPVKNSYTGRRQSISSTVSSLGHSEPSAASPTSTVADVAPVLSSVSTTVQSEPNVITSSYEMSTAELSELHQKLQESLRLQGFDLNAGANRMKRSNYMQRRTATSQSPRGLNAGSPRNASIGSSGSQQSKEGNSRVGTDERLLNKQGSESGRKSSGPSRDQNYRTKSRNVGHGQPPSSGGQQ